MDSIVRRAFLPILAISMLFAVSASAEDTSSTSTHAAEADAKPDYGRSGAFIWLGAGSGIPTRAADPLSAAAGIPIDVFSTTGFNGRLGASGGLLAAEAQFEYLPSFTAAPYFLPGLTLAEYSLLVGTANLKLQGQVSRVEPYLLLGLGFSWSQTKLVNQSFFDIALRGGGGVNVYLTKNIALTLDATYVWTGYQSNQDLDYVSIGYGLMYKF